MARPSQCEACGCFESCLYPGAPSCAEGPPTSSDGTDGPKSMPGPDYSADPYHGYYDGKKYAL